MFTNIKLLIKYKYNNWDKKIYLLRNLKYFVKTAVELDNSNLKETGKIFKSKLILSKFSYKRDYKTKENFAYNNFIQYIMIFQL